MNHVTEPDTTAEPGLLRGFGSHRETASKADRLGPMPRLAVVKERSLSKLIHREAGRFLLGLHLLKAVPFGQRLISPIEEVVLPHRLRQAQTAATQVSICSGESDSQMGTKSQQNSWIFSW